MKISHPLKDYSGPINVGRRIWFLDGEAEATNLKPRHRKALEDAGFVVVNPRAQGDDEDTDDDEDDAGASDEP